MIHILVKTSLLKHFSSLFLSGYNLCIQGLVFKCSFLYCIWPRKWIQVKEKNNAFPRAKIQIFLWRGYRFFFFLKRKWCYTCRTLWKLKREFCSCFGCFQDSASASLWNCALGKGKNITLIIQAFEITLFLWNEIFKSLSVREIVHGC